MAEFGSRGSKRDGSPLRDGDSMAVVVDVNGTLYEPVSFIREDEFEKCVVALADRIFGPSTIYVGVKKRMHGNNIISIPDGYLVDLADPQSPRLFVVENEIVSHDPFKHIGIQMLRFATSFEEARTLVRNFIMDEISKTPAALARLEAGCKESSYRNIDNYLDQAVYGGFRGLVVIDEARHELHRVLEKINADISVLELRAYESVDGGRIYEFDTLYDEYDPEPTKAPTAAPADRSARRARRAVSDTIIVPAREEGFREVFLGENRWYSIRVGAAMKEKVRYIAGYQVAPISAVTHIAEVQEIRPWKDTGKYVVVFKDAAQEIGPIRVKDPNRAPQGPIYVRREDLLQAKCLEDAMSYDA